MCTQRFKDRLSSDISEDPHQQDPGQRTTAVNDYIPDRAAAPADKVLMELVERRKADTEDPSGDEQPDPAYAVHVQRECYSDCQQEIFGEMCKLPDVKVYFADTARYLFVCQLQVERPVSDGHGFVGYPVAQIGAGSAVLCREGKDDVHHH